MEILTRKIRFITRGLFIACVLSGLFISSGEGIQLFPFPTVFDQARPNAALFENGNSKKYSFSVHNSAAQQAVVKNKVQKTQKFFDLAEVGGGGNPKPAPFRFSAVRRDRFSPTFYKAARLCASPSNRAPPIV
jgi:hypothetical protein